MTLVGTAVSVVAQLDRLPRLSMHIDLSTSGRVTMKGWVKIPCPLSTMARWQLWAVQTNSKKIRTFKSIRYRQVSVMNGHLAITDSYKALAKVLFGVYTKFYIVRTKCQNKK